MRLIIEARLADGDNDTVEEGDGVLAVIERPDCCLAELGLTLAEGRSLLAKVQAELISKQVQSWLSGQTHCRSCGAAFNREGQSLDGAAHRLRQSDGDESEGCGRVLASGLRGHRCITLLLARSIGRPSGPRRRWQALRKPPETKFHKTPEQLCASKRVFLQLIM